MQTRQILSLIRTCFFAVSLLVFSGSVALARSRSRISFNEGWKFYPGDNALVQLTKKAGTITFTATSDGFQSSSITLVSK